MSSQFGKWILRYLIWIGLPYLFAKQIEKYLWKRLNPEIKKKLNEKLKKLPDIENVSEETRNGLGNRGGGEPILTVWLTKLIVVDFALKSAIAGGIFATIWSGTADNAAKQLAKYGSAIVTAPGNKFKGLYKRLKGLNLEHSEDIREILLDKDLTNLEKVELLKIKLQQAFKDLKGSKRKKFILFVIATILFSVGGNVGAFAWFMDRLRALIGTDDDDSLKKAIIEVYQEYNAPLPKELVEDLPVEILESIRSID